jgi:hypothetical protein
MEELNIIPTPETVHPQKHMFVSDEIAKELQRIGFNEPCFAYYRLSYTDDTYKFYMVGERSNNGYTDSYINYVGVGLSNEEILRNPTGRLKSCFVAPMYQQVIDWFAEKHSKYIYAFRYDGKWQYKIDAEHGCDYFAVVEGCSDRYEALTQGILYLLKDMRLGEFIANNIKL